MSESTQPGHQCAFMQRCPMFPLFQLDGVRRIYQAKYCTSDFESCKRYKIASTGRMPEPRLLPDGRMLPSSVRTPNP